MPVFKIIKFSSTTSIYIWKITEDLQELEENLILSKVSLNRIASMKSLHQIKCFMAVRKLLNYCNYTDLDLLYTSFGKPFLKDKKNISISHSNEFACIIISDCNVGIDIELKGNKILKNIPLLFNENFIIEFNGSVEDKIRLLTFCWGIKESLFKIIPENDISFKKNISIEPFALHNKTCKASVHIDNKISNYVLQLEEIENYTLVYVVN